MNRINTSFISDPSTQQPWTGPELSYVQDNVQQMAVALAKTFYPDAPIAPYILYGCEKSDVGGGYFTFNSGYIFTQPNYDVTLMNAVTTPLLITGSNVAILTEQILPDTGGVDPLTFSDGIARNVGQNKSYVVSAGLPGSGYANYDDLPNVQDTLVRTPTPIKVGSVSGVSYASGFTEISSSLPLYYWKDNMGYVHIQGSCFCTSTEVLYANIFTLPVGYRPTLETKIKFCANDLINMEVLKDIIVFNTGEVAISPPTNNDRYSLGHISFLA